MMVTVTLVVQILKRLTYVKDKHFCKKETLIIKHFISQTTGFTILEKIGYIEVSCKAFVKINGFIDFQKLLIHIDNIIFSSVTNYLKVNFLTKSANIFTKIPCIIVLRKYCS